MEDNITGQVVFGDKYFRRPKDEERIWRRLKKGEHLLLLALRRVGKTSLLRYLETIPKDGYVFLYSMVQSCDTEHKFCKQVLENLYSSDFTKKLDKFTHKSKELITSIINTIDGIDLGEAGISFKNTEFKSKINISSR